MCRCRIVEWGTQEHVSCPYLPRRGQIHVPVLCLTIDNRPPLPLFCRGNRCFVVLVSSPLESVWIRTPPTTTPSPPPPSVPSAITTAPLSCSGLQVKTQTAEVTPLGRSVQENATTGLTCGQGWRGKGSPKAPPPA